MAHRILWLLLIVFICVTGLAAPVSAAPDVDRATPLAVTGYILGGAGDGLVERNAHALTTLTVVGVSLTADGRHVVDPDRGTTRLRSVAAGTVSTSTSKPCAREMATAWYSWWGASRS